MDYSQFENDYNLDKLAKITLANFDISMLVTPRFQNLFTTPDPHNITMNLVRNLSQNCDIFIDVGAHFGQLALIAGKDNSHLKIIAFEPVPENWEILRRNLEINDITNTVVINKAISNRKTRAEFNKSIASECGGLFNDSTIPSLGQFEVETIPLSEILTEFKDLRTLINISTNGHEMQVLESCEEILRENDNIQLLLELNPTGCQLNGSTPELILTRLREIGYTTFFLDDQNHRYFQPNDGGVTSWASLVSANHTMRLLCKKKSIGANYLFFSHSSALAGAERSLLELVKELIVDQGAMCTVVLPSNGMLEAELHRLGAGTLISSLKLWCTGVELADPLEKIQINNISFGWLLDHIHTLIRINPGSILTNTIAIPWGAVAAYLMQKPHLWLVHEYGVLDHGLIFFLPFPQILELIEQSSDYIITNARGIKDTLFPHVSEHIETINYYIDVTAATQSSAINVDAYFTNPIASHIFMSGTVMPSKGQEDAVRAVIELALVRKRNVELIIMGDARPDFKDFLLTLITDAGAENYVHFFPFQKDAIKIAQSSDIILVCSRMEAYGRVTQEAMLLGKAVVGTNTGGTSELIKDGYIGLVYPPGEYLLLANQIESLLDNENLRQELGQNAFTFAKNHFTKERYGGKYQQLLTEIITQPYKPKNQFSSFVISLYQELLILKQGELDSLHAALSNSEIQLAYFQSKQQEPAGLPVQEIHTPVVNQQDSLESIKMSSNPHDSFNPNDHPNSTQAEGEDLGSGNNSVEHLLEVVHQKELRIGVLSGQFNKSVQDNSKLTEQLERCAIDNSTLSTRVSRLEEGQQNLQSELNSVYTSRTWRLAQLPRRIRLMIAPFGSRRAKWIARLFNTHENTTKVETQETVTDTQPPISDYELVKQSSLFDEQWYLKSYRDVADAKFDPALHYLLHGGFEGRDPGPDFWSNEYLDVFPEILQLKQNPLVHYLKRCMAENKTPVQQKIVQTSETESPVVSIVIVVLNALAMTQACIDSIYKDNDFPKFEVLVVDNASSDGTHEWLQQQKDKSPNLSVFTMDKNIGFGPAVNIGLQHSRGEYIVLINNDTLVPNGWMNKLITAMQSDPTIGIISPVTSYVGEGPQLDKEAEGMAPDLNLVEEYSQAIAARNELIYEPNRLVFFCVMLRRNLADMVGHLDEGYEKGNYEDDDLCLRARMAGYRLAIARNVFVYHHGSATFKANRISHNWWMEKNRKRFYQKAALIAGTPLPKQISEYQLTSISVIVRTKDRPSLLTRALQSLANQTFKNFEAVVVNDGGADVEPLLEHFRQFFPITYVYHPVSKGRTAAINAGHQNAHGDWIAYLDDDDILYPWHFESLWNATDQGKTKRVVYSSYNLVLYKRAQDLQPIKIKGEAFIEFNRSALLLNNFIPIHAYLHPADAAKKIGPWDEQLDRLEDYEFLLRLSKIYDFKNVSKITCAYNTYLDIDNSSLVGRNKYIDALEVIFNRHTVSDLESQEARLSIMDQMRNQIKKIEEITRNRPINEEDRLIMNREIIHATMNI
jgi:FkbM family methyltransferase